MYTKKQLFKRPHAPSLANGSNYDVSRIKPEPGILAERVQYLGSRSTIVVEGSLLDETSRHYRKHALALDITGEAARTPMRKFELALQRSDDVEFSGYAWRGFSPDSRPRVVPLVKLLEGAKLFAYEMSKVPTPRADLTEEQRLGTRIYDDTTKAFYDGACAVATVSRRTTKESNHKIILTGVPLRDGAGWRNINASTSCCIDNKFSNVRYTGVGDPKRKIFCSHEIAGYWKVAATLYAEGKEDAARLSPFIAPSQELIDFYKRLTSRVAVKEKHHRLMNEGEMEQVLQAYVRSLPFDHLFSNKGKLAERNWT